MFFANIDYIAATGKSFLHRLPAWLKLIALLALIVFVLLTYNYEILLLIYIILVLLMFSARLPLLTVYLPSLYPLFFLVIFFLSIQNLTLYLFLVYSLRVLCISLTLLIILVTSGFLEIFATLGKVLPAAFTSVIFLTYRSLFIAEKSLKEILATYYLKGAINWSKPIQTIKNLGKLFGFLIIKILDKSEKQTQILYLRGFEGRIYYGKTDR